MLTKTKQQYMAFCLTPWLVLAMAYAMDRTMGVQDYALVKLVAVLMVLVLPLLMYVVGMAFYEAGVRAVVKQQRETPKKH